MKKTYLITSSFSLLGVVAASAVVIAPGTITGTVAGDAGSNVAFLGDNSGLSTTLNGGETLAAAQATTHFFTDTGHAQSWTNGIGAGTPIFTIDLGVDISFGTALLWQYGNNGGPGLYDAGNSTREFELIFHTAAEGATFTGESAEYAGTMAYIDAGGDSTSTNIGQTFQFAETTARYVQLTIISNWGGQTVSGNTVLGGDRFGLGEVRFATESIPEPSSAALLGLAGLGLIIRRRR